MTSQNVESKVINAGYGSVGYVKVGSFMEQGLCTQFKNHLDSFYQNKIQGLVIDLRFNGGGLVSEAMCMMGLFLDKGSLVWVNKDLKKDNLTAIKNPSDGNYDRVHTTVLINGGSASASEATSMYFKANRKAYVGERSFGKGTMQSIKPFDSSKKIIKGETIAKYYGPHFVSPQIQGVMPEFVVNPDITQTGPTPFSREEDLYSNAIKNQKTQVPVMPDRVEEIKKISEVFGRSSRGE